MHPLTHFTVTSLADQYASPVLATKRAIVPVTSFLPCQGVI